METFLIRALQLIASLSLLVLIHEFGHFLFARIFHIRVERFYMFFHPLFSIVRIKKIAGKLKFSWFSSKSPESFEEHPEKTEFGIGWVPLGGYCAISGMIDETTSKLDKETHDWEFRTKPAWQRLLVMAGGVLFNFILALCLYSVILNLWGEEYIPLKNAKMGMEYSSAAKNAGFRDGDILLSADNKKLDRYDENCVMSIVDASNVSVLRNGSIFNISIPKDFMENMLAEKEGFAALRFPTVVNSLVVGSPAEKAGLVAGDSLVSINDTSVVSFYDFSSSLHKNSGKEILLGYYRKGNYNSVKIKPDENGKLGFYPSAPASFFKTKKVNYNVFNAVPAGIKLGIGKLTGYANSMKYVFTEEGVKSLGGFAAIGSLFPSTWSWEIFWETTAFLSIILAFMNILPIPALDGGHILFLLYEVITRRKPSDKFMEYAQMAGMIFLFALLIFANGNDIYRLIFK